MYNLKNVTIFCGLVFVWFFALSGPAQAVELRNIRFGAHGSAVRAVLELDSEADFRAFVQDGPPRVTLDLPQLSGTPAIKREDLPAIIKDVRLEPLGSGRSRLTFILNSPAVIRSAFLMPASGKMPVRLVLDASPTSQQIFASNVGRPYGTLSEESSDTKPAIKTPTPPSLPFAGNANAKLQPLSRPLSPEAQNVEEPVIDDNRPLIMIDPGHGGIDPGASGSGVREKNVTLNVGKALRSALEKTGKYRVKMTRDSDTFVRLSDRVLKARRINADLFVSIHADSSPEATSAHGASFYTISDQASDAQTARLAQRENQADLLAGITLPTQDKEVAGILIDLATRETTSQSKRFAGQLISAFNDNSVALLPAPDRHAGFVVLKAPDVPSVLIELGFLSNPEEARKLADPAYTDALAKAIAGGVDNWFKAKKSR